MVFYYDLEVFASMNGIHRTPDHAMWIGAGATRRGNHEIIQALSGAEQTRDRNTVRLDPVLLDTASGTGIAPRAIVQVEHENALALIKTLRDVLVEDSMTHG